MKSKIVPVLCLLAAAGVQANLPSGIDILGSGPNIVLVVLIAFSLASDASSGLVLGFAAGLIEGSVVGSSMSSFIVTRTIAGFIAGISTITFFSVNPVVSIVTTAWLTVACELLFVLANPAASLLVAARTIAGEAIWNSLLSFLLVFVLRYFGSRRRIRISDFRVRY